MKDGVHLAAWTIGLIITLAVLWGGSILFLAAFD